MEQTNINKQVHMDRQTDMDKKGSVVVQLLVMLVVIVLTSAAILLLIKFDVISVGSSDEDVPVLNTEFIPMGAEGSLVVKEFQFCSFVDDNYNCLDEKQQFNKRDDVYFRFVVESSTSNGQVRIIENYKLIDPQGKVILDVDEQNNFNFEIRSEETLESITFKDYFIAGVELTDGEYILELHLQNPLINKRTKAVKYVEIW